MRRRSRGAGEAAPARPLLLSESVVIELPPEEVFAYVSDPQNLPEWTLVIREVRKETEGPPREGARYTVDIGFLGRRFEQSFEVSAYEPPWRYSERNLGGPFQEEHTYTFEEAGEGGGTYLSLALEVHSGGFFRMSYPLLLEKAARRQVRKELGFLKDMLELRAMLEVRG